MHGVIPARTLGSIQVFCSLLLPNPIHQILLMKPPYISPASFPSLAWFQPSQPQQLPLAGSMERFKETEPLFISEEAKHLRKAL